MQIGATQGAATGSSAISASSVGEMSSQDFYELLISELKNQDPFQPNETSDMISQVSQIRSIEVSSQLTDTLDRMTETQRNLSAAELIGKHVEGVVEDDDGAAQQIAGVVTGVTFADDGSTVLELDTGQAINAKDVTKITSTSTADLPTAPTEGADDEAAAADSVKADATARRTTPAAQPSFGMNAWWPF